MEAERGDEQIRKELEELRQRVAELEAAEPSHRKEDTPGLSDGYFRHLVENAYELILVINRDFSLRFVSPSAKRMTGYEPEEVLSMNAFEFVHPDDIPELVEKFTAGIQEPGRVEHIEYRTRRKDGSYFITEAVAVNMLDNPNVEAVVVNLRDITEYRRIEKELRESEERYRFLVENLNDVVFTVDTQGTVLYMSPAIERISHYTAGEVMGQPFMHFIHPEDLPGLLQSFQRTMDGFLEPHEFRVIDKDGSLIHVQTSSRPFDEEGRAAGLIGVMSEITERKQAEEARRRSEESFRAMIRKNIHYYRGS
ncbi:MAG: PAS domain S-box protein [Actinomycetota bacterium]